MTEEQILAEIAPYIVRQLLLVNDNDYYSFRCNCDALTMDDKFAYFDADSLDMVEIVMEFEKKFNIDISDEERGGLQTVGDLVRLIKRKLDEKKPSVMVLFLMRHGGKKLPRKMPRKPVAKLVMPQKPVMFNPGKKR